MQVLFVAEQKFVVANLQRIFILLHGVAHAAAKQAAMLYSVLRLLRVVLFYFILLCCSMCEGPLRCLTADVRVLVGCLLPRFQRPGLRVPRRCLVAIGPVGLLDDVVAGLRLL